MSDIETLTNEERRALCSFMPSVEKPLSYKALRIIDAQAKRIDELAQAHVESQENGAREAIARKAEKRIEELGAKLQAAVDETWRWGHEWQQAKAELLALRTDLDALMRRKAGG